MRYEILREKCGRLQRCQPSGFLSRRGELAISLERGENGGFDELWHDLEGEDGK